MRRFFREWRHSRALRRSRTLDYEGLTVPTRRSGLINPILVQLYACEYERPEINGLSSVIRPGDRVLEL
ncbi:MAG: hypothetical protein MUE83_14480, partial [Tabrizicola sp.]|nr:hypothetical protein [Tabrizicola sp.]